MNLFSAAVQRILPKGRIRKRSASSPAIADLKAQVETAVDFMRAYHTDWTRFKEAYDPTSQEKSIQAALRSRGLDQFVDDVVTSQLVFTTVETHVASLSQIIGSWYVVAEAPPLEDIAKRLTGYMQAYFEERGLPIEIEKAFADALTIGTGAVKVSWYEDEVLCSWLDPWMLYPDPRAQRIEDCEYIAIRHLMGEDQIKLVYPEFDVEKSSGAYTTDMDTNPDFDKEDKSPEYYELWEVYHDFGASLTVYSGDQVLRDGPSPVPYGRYPIFIFPLYQRKPSLWGAGIVERIMGHQQAMDLSMTRMAIHEKLTVNPMLKTNDPSFKGRIGPGEILRMNGPQYDVNYLVPPQLTQEVYNRLTKLQQDADTISGAHEITRGIRPKGTTSGISLEVLRDEANKRVGQAARNWTRQMVAMGQLVLEFMQAYYADDRSIATMAGGTPRMATASPDMLAEDQYSYGENGEPEQQRVPLPLRVVMQPLGEMPISPTAKFEKAIRLRQLGDIDQQAMLEAAQFEGREGVLERVKAQMAAFQEGQAAAAQQAQQAPPGPQDMLTG